MTTQTLAHTILNIEIPLSAEEALKSTARHVLTNAVGGFSEEVQVDVERLQLANGDRVLLCSDGLTDAVDDDAIRAALQQHSTSEAACRALIDHALAGGGRDNITVVVAGFTWSDEE